MDKTNSGQAPGSVGAAFQASIHYWEPRRAAYNLVLAAITLAWLILTWPHFRPAFTFGNLLRLLILALIANIPYCAVYAIDIPLQLSSIRELWIRRRWILWTVGVLFAALFTCYWIADEIYPYVS
jgi:hypothetical protein